MAPKKKTESSSFLLKIPTEKISKAKPFKPQNKLKVKFQSKNVKNAIGGKKKTLDPKSPAEVEMKDMLTLNPQNDMKIDRMNEVARAQLVKECPVAVTESAPAPVAKKRGRKKKIPEPETAEVVPKKKPKLPTKAKVPTKNMTKKVAKRKAPKETAEVVPKKQPKLPTKAKVPTKKTTKKVAKTKTPKVAAPKRKAASKISPSISPPPKRQRCRQRKPGKPAEDDCTITSPSILSYCQTEVKTPDKDTQKTIAKSPVVPNATENNNESRRTSITSAPASELSWTKDLSESSTTTCITVTSNDFVRIDGKLPELKLTKLKKCQIRPNNSEEGITQVEPERSSSKDSNFSSFKSSSNLKNSLIEDKSEEPLTEKIEPEHSLSEDSSSSSSSNSSSSSSSSSQSDKSAIENGLNLSTSSITAPPYSPTYTPRNQSFDKTKQDEVTSILEILAPKLKTLDLDFPGIDDDDEDYDMSPFEEKVSKYFDEEYNTILECSFLNRILSESYLPNTTAPEIEQKHSEEPDFAMSNHTAISDKSVCDNFNNTPSSITRRRVSDDSDDDVLQLYATDNDLDSTRMGSAASIFEEYVPQPLIQRPPTAVRYQPSKINEPETSSAKKPVCEKQNADSTSIHKEPELNDASNETPETISGTGLAQTPINKSTAANKRPPPPPLTISYYPFRSRDRSATLSGVCFLNLSSMCNRQDPFHLTHIPHRFIEEDEFRMRIAQLSESQFIQEYNHIARWAILRKKYVICFIDECQRRELPKILVEIVIDFLFRTPPNIVEHKDLRVQVIEHALMHLNNWNLMVCEQLLEYNLGDEVLCDVFLKIIANTQNFSRFKKVFVNLIDFMVRANRTFEFDVAFHILERVCILPFDVSLAMSLISILAKTDREIFKNSLTNRFELSLETYNKELYNRYLSIKMEGVSSVRLKSASEPGASLPPSLPSPCGSRGSRELEPPIFNPNSAQDSEQRYTSPDTTNVDNVNKVVTEPTIIRTFNHLDRRPPNMGMCMPRPPPPRPLPPRPQYRKWNECSIMARIPRMPYMRLPRPVKRPTARPGHPSSKFQRRYGPDFKFN